MISNSATKPQTTAQDILLYGHTTGKIRFWIAIELGCHWQFNFGLTGTITYFVKAYSDHIQEYQSMIPFTFTLIYGGFTEHSKDHIFKPISQPFAR